VQKKAVTLVIVERLADWKGGIQLQAEIFGMFCLVAMEITESG
jgi:hypothetical protein